MTRTRFHQPMTRSLRWRATAREFRRKKEEAIAALLTQRNIEEAARVAGIGVQTLYRWLKLPEFQAEYREARRTAVAQAHARLQQVSGSAVMTLVKVMADPNTPPATRVRAADCILDHVQGSIESEDTELRLAALERNREAAASLPQEGWT